MGVQWNAYVNIDLNQLLGLFGGNRGNVDEAFNNMLDPIARSAWVDERGGRSSYETYADRFADGVERIWGTTDANQRMNIPAWSGQLDVGGHTLTIPGGYYSQHEYADVVLNAIQRSAPGISAEQLALTRTAVHAELVAETPGHVPQMYSVPMGSEEDLHIADRPRIDAGPVPEIQITRNGPGEPPTIEFSNFPESEHRAARELFGIITQTEDEEPMTPQQMRDRVVAHLDAHPGLAPLMNASIDVTGYRSNMSLERFLSDGNVRDALNLTREHVAALTPVIGETRTLANVERVRSTPLHGLTDEVVSLDAAAFQGPAADNAALQTRLDAILTAGHIYQTEEAAAADIADGSARDQGMPNEGRAVAVVAQIRQYLEAPGLSEEDRTARAAEVAAQVQRIQGDETLRHNFGVSMATISDAQLRGIEDEGVRRQLTETRDQMLADVGDDGQVSGEGMNFFEMIIALIAEFLPEDSEIRQTLLNMIGQDDDDETPAREGETQEEGQSTGDDTTPDGQAVEGQSTGEEIVDPDLELDGGLDTETRTQGLDEVGTTDLPAAGEDGTVGEDVTQTAPRELDPGIILNTDVLDSVYDTMDREVDNAEYAGILNGATASAEQIEQLQEVLRRELTARGESLVNPDAGIDVREGNVEFTAGEAVMLASILPEDKQAALLQQIQAAGLGQTGAVTDGKSYEDASVQQTSGAAQQALVQDGRSMMA